MPCDEMKFSEYLRPRDILAIFYLNCDFLPSLFTEKSFVAPGPTQSYANQFLRSTAGMAMPPPSAHVLWAYMCVRERVCSTHPPSDRHAASPKFTFGANPPGWKNRPPRPNAGKNFCLGACSPIFNRYFFRVGRGVARRFGGRRMVATPTHMYGCGACSKIHLLKGLTLRYTQHIS